jgi:hypothetical protein
VVHGSGANSGTRFAGNRLLNGTDDLKHGEGFDPLQTAEVENVGAVVRKAIQLFSEAIARTEVEPGRDSEKLRHFLGRSPVGGLGTANARSIRGHLRDHGCTD